MLNQKFLYKTEVTRKAKLTAHKTCIYIYTNNDMWMPIVAATFEPPSLRPFVTTPHPHTCICTNNLDAFRLLPSQFRSNKCSSPPKLSDQLRGPPVLIFSGYRGCCPRVKRSELESDLSHLVPILTVRAAPSPLSLLAFVGSERVNVCHRRRALNKTSVTGVER